MSPTPRSGSTILVERRLLSTTSPSVATLFPTSTSSFLPKLSKRPVSVPTSTLSRTPVRKPSTCVSGSTPSTLSGSTRCCPVPVRIGCNRVCEVLGVSLTAPSPVSTCAFPNFAMSWQLTDVHIAVRSSCPSDAETATRPSSLRPSDVLDTSSPDDRRSSSPRSGVSLLSTVPNTRPSRPTSRSSTTVPTSRLVSKC